MSLFLNFVESEKMAPMREVRDCCLDNTSWNNAWARLLAGYEGLASISLRSPLL
jgi:hypothetical protein